MEKIVPIIGGNQLASHLLRELSHFLVYETDYFKMIITGASREMFREISWELITEMARMDIVSTKFLRMHFPITHICIVSNNLFVLKIVSNNL